MADRWIATVRERKQLIGLAGASMPMLLRNIQKIVRYKL